ncbi:MAG: tetratricopeptide repeat protein [Deltaproteobacteria bacterium]|nr:tetratricopeptide repeat protein [Deltaproteobacteria bacterium]
MSSPTATDAGVVLETAAPEVRYIGPYRLLHLLGEGGMGQVWLADQDEPVRRKVAVKIIKAGMDTKQVVARFESERQALALMNHEAIAKVFDGGSTPEGRPFFVMEYVAGISLTEHCDLHTLSTRDRIELLCEVCEGVQHAHQKAVIHRDLKPSNILVTLADGKAQPKIIDFGVAKATGQRLTDRTLQTALGAVVGTLEYMSPEQADPTGQDVDTRADVYSLGVILYELLTGELPFSSHELRTSDPLELARKLRDDEAPRPSVRVSKPSAATQAAARKRGIEQPALRSLLKGDLDAIALKALEKQRSRRYGTPSELAADLRRYLRNEPVLAQPPSAAYQVRKYVQRNKPVVAGGLAVLASLVAGVIVSAWQAQRARAAERQAASEAAAAKATNEFLQNDLLGQADVGQQQGAAGKADPDIRVRTLLDRAAGRIEGRFAGQPEVEASIRGSIGEAYLSLALFPEAHPQLARALELWTQTRGADHPQTLVAAASLGSLLVEEANFAQAQPLLADTLERQKRVLGPEHPNTLRTLVELGRMAYSQAKRTEARALFAQALEGRRRALGPEHRETLLIMRLLANIDSVTNHPDSALALYQQTLEAQRRVLGPEHPETLATLSALGTFFSNFGRLQEAAATLRELLPIARRVWGPEHPQTLQVELSLAIADADLGRTAEAEAAVREVLELRNKVYGPEHPRTVSVLAVLAGIQLSAGRAVESEATARRALTATTKVFGPDKPQTLDASEGVAEALDTQGKLAAAAAQFEAVLETRRRTQGPEYRDTLITRRRLASMRAAQGRYDEASAMQRSLLEPMARVLGPQSPSALGVQRDLGLTLCWQGDRKAAQAVFTPLLETARRLGPEAIITLSALNAAGACALLLGQLAEAEPLLREAWAGRRKVLGPTDADTLDSLFSLALTLHARGELPGAEALARESVEGERATRPQAWARSLAEAELGAILAAQGKATEAAPLLRTGQKGLAAKTSSLSAPDRLWLERARKVWERGGR